MDIVDTNKLETAIVYLQRIAEGRNPVNNMPVEDDSVINNPNVVRCMFFVKEVLEELKRNDGYIGKKPRTNKGKDKPDYPLEVLLDFHYTGDKSITKFVDQLNSMTDTTVCKKITFMSIRSWLKKNGYLSEENDKYKGKKSTIVTSKGTEVGIKSELRKDSRGVDYMYISYGREAQELIVANMDKIL
ncbi:MAG: hypothetical protein IJ703_01770 [Eubacterium sp.]|nr:hypothetical protein [Eubacterium sp.]